MWIIPDVLKQTYYNRILTDRAVLGPSGCKRGRILRDMSEKDLHVKGETGYVQANPRRIHQAAGEIEDCPNFGDLHLPALFGACDL